ncbi:MAG: helix-turn-helix domain-containing protein [Chloroflexota bacterium]|nr:helix-turn-helix domain-containing protein [Chloroflexota bacterium]
MEGSDGLTVHQVAKRLGLSLDRVRLLLQRGELVGHKDERGTWFVTEDAVEVYRPRMKKRARVE